METARMNGQKERTRRVAVLLAAAITALPACAAETATGSGAIAALTGGKPYLNLRLRFEHVDDDATAEDGEATTLRTVVGYRTGDFYGFHSLLELESVLAAGDYNDGGANRGMGRYAAIVDPEGIELNQGYLAYTGLPGTTLAFGRQVVTDREAPLHRYLGTVLWRQNWQTHDAFSIENNSVKDLRLRFWYSYNINRIFGEDNPTRGLDDKGLDGFLFNAQYGALPVGKIEAYAYLLDFEGAMPAGGFYQSTQTYGLRLDGKRGLAPAWDLLYAGELAWQSDWEDNPNEIDALYVLGALGATWRPGGPVQAITVKGQYELLGGDGGADRFTTPLATGHAFQGWADEFLNTPGDGIEDIQLIVSANAWGFAFTAWYHDFNSDRDDYDYGTELDVQLTRQFFGRYLAGIKYSDYDGDTNALNLARNPARADDISKFWAWLQVAF